MLKQEWDKAPDWAKFLLAFGTIFAIVKWFPIVEILQLFFYIVIIPFGLLLAVGFISMETFDSFCEIYQQVVTKLKESQNNNPPPVQVNDQEDNTASDQQ